MYNFRNLRIWQNARVLVAKVYLETQAFPQEERFGLAIQMRRAAISIPSNIAEGCGREGEKSVQQFLNYAIGSAFELETQLLLSADLQYIPLKTVEELVQSLQGLQKGIYIFKQKLQ